MRRILRGLAVLLISILAGTVLMIAAYCCPVSMIQKHTGETVVLLGDKRVDGHIKIDVDVEKLDNAGGRATYAGNQGLCQRLVRI